MFAALESRNFRLFVVGQSISLIGTWMSQTAALWLVYHLSSSPFLLGVVGFASQLPIFLMAPLAGVWVDRVHRHRLLVFTQVCSMLQSFALAGLTLSGRMTPGWLIALSLVQGVINGLDLPVRQALVVAFVPKRAHLTNAIALNSSLFNLARLIGPAIAGLTIAAVGAGMCFLIDAFSYAAVIISLLMMRLKVPPKRTNLRHPLVEMREGFEAAFGYRPIRALLIMVAIISAVGFSYVVLTPLFARDVFGGDARVLGYLMSASGAGALAGALYLGTRKGVRGLGIVMTVGGVSMGAGLIMFASSKLLPFACFSLALVGLGGVLLMASSNTVVQALVTEERRGRVMSIFTMAFTGTMPFGNLLVGWLAGRVGARPTLIASGAICLVTSAVFYRLLPGLRAAAAPELARLETAEVE